jgi:carboxylesterase type B
MMNAWVAFARTGDPVIPDLDWTPYDGNKRSTMILDEVSELVDAPFEEERAVWDDLIK